MTAEKGGIRPWVFVRDELRGFAIGLGGGIRHIGHRFAALHGTPPPPGRAREVQGSLAFVISTTASAISARSASVGTGRPARSMRSAVSMRPSTREASRAFRSRATFKSAVSSDFVNSRLKRPVED